MRQGNDALLKNLLKETREAAMEATDAGTEVAALLQKRARQSEDEQAKRRKEAIEERRLAANEAEEKKRATALAQAAAQEARLACLKQANENRRYEHKQRARSQRARCISRWLETEFATILADRLVRWYRGIRHIDRERYTREVTQMLGSGSFRRHPANIPNLWIPTTASTFRGGTQDGYVAPQSSTRS